MTVVRYINNIKVDDDKMPELEIVNPAIVQIITDSQVRIIEQQEVG